MRFVVVTGMSGAGKSSVMKIMEDDGFFCVDNLPVSLLSSFLQLAKQSGRNVERIAVGLDIRAGEKDIRHFEELSDEISSEGYPLEILFLEAKTNVLVKRFKETRRNHPLTGEVFSGRDDSLNSNEKRQSERVESYIKEERNILSGLRKKADIIIDTSSLLIRDLKQEIDRIFTTDGEVSNFYLMFMSFGFKYGIPSDADIVFDVRFLPNPYYVDELKPLTGNDRAVYDYVMNSEAAGEFLHRLKEMLDFLIPNYIIEGKTGLVVAIGCTGGKHRSVTLTNAICSEYMNGEYGCKKEHRDIEKDRARGK